MADLPSLIDDYISALDGDTRRVAYAEWGITLDAAGWPLHVGVALREGLLRAQAHVVGAGAVDEHQLLFWNRQVPLVRFAHTRDGEVYVLADLPRAAVSEDQVDKLLGLLVRVATQAREMAAERVDS